MMHQVDVWTLGVGGWTLTALDVASARTSGRTKTVVDITGWVCFAVLAVALVTWVVWAL